MNTQMSKLFSTTPPPQDDHLYRKRRTFTIFVDSDNCDTKLPLASGERVRFTARLPNSYGDIALAPGNKCVCTVRDSTIFLYDTKLGALASDGVEPRPTSYVVHCDLPQQNTYDTRTKSFSTQLTTVLRPTASLAVAGALSTGRWAVPTSHHPLYRSTGVVGTLEDRKRLSTSTGEGKAVSGALFCNIHNTVMRADTATYPCSFTTTAPEGKPVNFWVDVPTHLLTPDGQGGDFTLNRSETGGMTSGSYVVQSEHHAVLRVTLLLELVFYD